MSAPRFVITSGGPAVVHSSDFSLVTAAKPASAGEVLSLIATGLGPTSPDTDLNTPFPTDSLVGVNSPVTVTANGANAEILGAVGYPGAVDAYQVNFRMPSGVGKGFAAIRLSSACITGEPVNIAVQ